MSMLSSQVRGSGPGKHSNYNIFLLNFIDILYLMINRNRHALTLVPCKSKLEKRNNWQRREVSEDSLNSGDVVDSQEIVFAEAEDGGCKEREDFHGVVGQHKIP